MQIGLLAGINISVVIAMPCNRHEQNRKLDRACSPLPPLLAPATQANAH